MSKQIDGAAHQVMDTVPLIMRTIRSEFRTKRSAELSVPQFRALAYIKNNDGASLSHLAGYIGLTLPSMSKLIDGLVNRGLVSRDAHREDRRKVCLHLTALGKSELESAYAHTQTFMAEKLSRLAKDELTAIVSSMQILRELFVSRPSE